MAEEGRLVKGKVQKVLHKKPRTAKIFCVFCSQV